MGKVDYSESTLPEQYKTAVGDKGRGGDELEKQGNVAAKPMATIRDDDERLLAQIGYKQVMAAIIPNRGSHSPSQTGATTGTHQMVHCVICHLYPWCSGFRPCNIRKPYFRWRTCDSCLVLVLWILLRILHSCFR
jgi:hypothetical protein